MPPTSSLAEDIRTLPYPSEPVDKDTYEAFTRRMSESYESYVQEERVRAARTAEGMQKVVLF